MPDVSASVVMRLSARGGVWVKAGTYIAVKPWSPRYPDPLILKKGDFVRCEREENEYGGFGWCEKGGKWGWVPLDIVEIIEDVRGRLKQDYSSKELALAIGDKVCGSKIVSRWLWATRVGTGEEGWVPLDRVEEIASAGVWR